MRLVLLDMNLFSATGRIIIPIAGHGALRVIVL